MWAFLLKGLPLNLGAFEYSLVTGFELSKSQNIPIQAYPNPFKDFFIMEIKLSDYENVTISLIDIRGEKIWNSGKMYPEEMRLKIYYDSLNIKQGIYFIVAETKSNRWIKKIAKI